MKLDKQFYKDAFGWGIVLWLFGYVLSIILFAFIPPSLLGWIITPLATAVTVFVLLKKTQSGSLQYYFYIGIVWTAIAVVFDYLFIVKLFKPEDGYYKPDVYLYYMLTFALPVMVGSRNHKQKP